MNVLFLNNFRGFKNAFLDIERVNFFVGENSTGKTSVLKVFKAIQDPNFWINKSFNLDIAELGYFDEIAGDPLKGKSSFFEIGCLSYNSKFAIKLVYIEERGVPIVKEVHILSNNCIAQFIIENETKLQYRYREIDNIDNTEDLKSYFKKWIKGIELNTSEFHIKEQERLFERMPLYFAVMNIMRDSFPDKNSNTFNIPLLAQHMYWCAPIRSTPRRVYDSPITEYNPDGSHAPFLLRDSLQFSTSQLDKEKKKKIEFILNKFGSDSGLFDQISIRHFMEDYSSPFQIQINIAGRNMNFTNVGYGVSQILPLLVEIIVREGHTSFAIQQPEVHLHPKGQAAFGDFIYKAFVEEDKMFIIETHSDYLIDRYRLRMSRHFKEDKEGELPSQIVFFSKSQDGNQMDCVKIQKNGKLPDVLPEGYRDFFIREQFTLLDI